MERPEGKGEERLKNTKRCPKCGSLEILRVPDDAHRYLANSVCITGMLTVKRIPVARYVCRSCGYLEDWVEHQAEREEIARAWGPAFDR